MRSLGDLYANGQGVPQDDMQARQWYEKAAGQVRQWYEKAAGNAGAKNSH